MVNSIESIREKNELNRKMDRRHEHGFHFTKEEPQMEIGKEYCLRACSHTHQVHVLNVINNQRTANKNKKVTPFTPIFVFPHPEKKNVTPFHPTRTGKYLKVLKMSSIGENLEPQKLFYNG